MTFGGEDLYEDLASKAAALMHSLIVRTGVRHLEGGKVTKRFIEASRRTLAKFDEAFRELAK
jgi:hypothetical protein